jgi:hypothetical protein
LLKANQAQIDEILDKISQSGYDSLTKDERFFYSKQEVISVKSKLKFNFKLKK